MRLSYFDTCYTGCFGSTNHHRILAKLTAEVPEHGTATFTVTMTCMKATLTAANNYRYTLIGDCRWTYPVKTSVYLRLTSFTFCICLFYIYLST